MDGVDNLKNEYTRSWNV